ncbi:hypothetical protein EAY64_05325 [Aquitalea palustris]|uniref:Uncharacterized protein n=1 Tax=Aquitalea palustris TaxID=2480983 RepID=A0A454JL67_9NEIS|nr:hypothetical protein [Aquitalea palustris]RMD00145.1 hypothetical protein EAY64_05325 [Aquitalea palustris]
MTTDVLLHQQLPGQLPGQVSADFITSNYVDLQHVVASSHPDVGQTQTLWSMDDYEFEVIELSDKHNSALPNQDQAQKIAQLKCFASKEAATSQLNQVCLFDTTNQITALRARMKKSKPGQQTQPVSLRVPVRQQPGRTHRSRPVRSKSSSAASKSSSDSDGPAPGPSHLTHLTSRSAHEQATSSQEVRQ